MEYALGESKMSSGNLCLPYGLLQEYIVKILAKCDEALGMSTNPSAYRQAITPCIKSNLDTFVAVQIYDLEKPLTYVYLRDVWQKECYIAQQIKDRSEVPSYFKSVTDEEIKQAEQDVSSFCGKDIKFDEKQIEAIKSAFEEKNTVITGAGGTGKSAICRCIFYLSQKRNLSIRMMSPTGKAAQVLSEKTGCQAATIHRSLKMKPGEDFPENPITEDIVIIDEVSMSGIDTMNAIMLAAHDKHDIHFVMVGDKNQLPSVSPGNFLFEIMQSKCANVVMLDKVHRQSEKSYIPLIAGEVAKGKVVDIPKDAVDMIWTDVNADNFGADLEEYVNEYLKNGNDIADLQFISPMKKGQCGVWRINELLQNKMADYHNTTSQCLEIGFQKFYEKDRVIQTENNYTKEVYNGDIGYIVSLGSKRISDDNDKMTRYVVVEYDGVGKVEYCGEDLNQIMLAWCITVHKFQGSASPYILFVMSSEANIMMSKELVYTAITRASKAIKIFGNNRCWKEAPLHSAIRKRYTNMIPIMRHLHTGKTLRVVQNG